MEKYLRDQLAATIRYLPASIAASYLKKAVSPESERIRRQNGGFIRGVCHPTEDFDQITGAGIRWIRVDIPYPFRDGGPSPSYTAFKERMKRFVDHGISVMAVTPFPKDFIAAGVDPRKPEDEPRVREIASFLAADLQGVVGALQICNEMGVPRFMEPLTSGQAVRYMGIQLEAVSLVKGDVLVGYNSAGPQCDQHAAMRPFHKYCDYVGFDWYAGCFFKRWSRMWTYDMIIRYLWGLTGKPVILCEFGYMGGGAPRTVEEKRGILNRYGASSEEEARQNIREFVERMPPRMKEKVINHASGDWGDFLFESDFKEHLYSELPAEHVMPGCPHTPEGQAKYYADILPRLEKHPYLAGAFIYCYADSRRCYYCGQEDCPIETQWGLTTVDGKEKPAYYAVRKAWLK
ncbi:MAG: hypothetical protein LBS11_10995 [Oscillospiraceae bacterium]|jgi:hypothetical protein|nr:hypothetical protein [Oscillospiraceae bacterium]